MTSIPQAIILAGSGKTTRQQRKDKKRDDARLSSSVAIVVKSGFRSPKPVSHYPDFLKDFLADQSARKAYIDSLPKNKRYELERSAAGSFTVDEWYVLCKSYDFICLRCKQPGLKLTVDHVMPLSKGGSHWISNLQCLCGPCNSSKGTKSTDYR
jgi:5-methylcytosine-specific restriction endonuclease McrA